MKKLSEYLLILLILVTTLGLEVKAQLEQLPLYSGAAGQNLQNLGLDTTNIDLVKQLADSADRIGNSSACVFLAQHNYPLSTATLRLFLYKSFSKRALTINDPYDYLYATYLLQRPASASLAREALDSLTIWHNSGDARYDESFIDEAVGLLMSQGDYSRFDDLSLATVEAVGRGHGAASICLEVFASIQEYKSRVLTLLKLVSHSVRDDDRDWAIDVLVREFSDLPETLQILHETAFNDGNAGNRDSAINYLLTKYNDLAGVRACLKLIADFPGNDGLADGVGLLGIFRSPQALSALEQIARMVPAGDEAEFVLSILNDYEPPHPPASEPLIQSVDSLSSFAFQIRSLGWLSDEAFVGNLQASLQRAHQLLAAHDSVGSARAIKAFQQKIDIVYGDSLNPDPRMVTVEGWKFLYYNAQYILDRLPAIPPSPVIASLNPATAYAGGAGFATSLKGKAFVPASAVVWNGSSRTTSVVADSVLQATILAADIAMAGTAIVAVVNPGNDTSNVLSFTVTQAPSGLSVKLINSAGTNLTGGSLQYYDGSWKDAVNNNDGTFHVNTTLATVSLRMTYEGGSQTKSNVAVGPDVVVFQTVNTQVKLQNSRGAPIDTGSVQYYFSSWKTLGQTMNGVASKELLPASYTFRMAYATVTNDKVQDISANSTVSFSTVLCTVTVKNGQGTPVDGAQVSYYFSSWVPIGPTVGGQVTKELLPASLTFRETIGSATQNKVQNIGTNALVEFVTQ